MTIVEALFVEKRITDSGLSLWGYILQYLDNSIAYLLEKKGEGTRLPLYSKRFYFTAGFFGAQQPEFAIAFLSIPLSTTSMRFSIPYLLR